MPVGYRASVTAVNTVPANRLGGITNDADVLLISVTVTAPGETIELQGYRTRHSPNMLP